MTRPPLPAVVRQFATECLALARVLAEAEAVQWSPSPVPRPRVDTSERSRGGHSDPVPGVVSDERRLAVREAFEQGSRALRLATDAVRSYRESVERALDRWAG